MLGRFAGLCVAAAVLWASSALAAGPYGLIKVGNWQGGAYTNDSTGRFSHCAASAAYVSGVLFFVAMDADGTWRVGFAHPDWQLRVGETFPIDFNFDGRERFNVFGTARTTTLVLVPMPSNSSLMSTFRKADMLMALAKGQVFQFKLTGTSQLMPSLVNCVETIRARGLKAAGDFTVRQAARAPATSNEVPSQGSLRSDVPNTNDLQIEAMEIASNFVIKSSLRNARLVPRAETPVQFAAFGAAWHSDEARGFVKIFPPDGRSKGLDVAAAVVAADAKDCKGKFASGRTSELVDSDVVFRGFASCDDSDGATLSHYFIVPRRKGGFVMISVITDLKSDIGQAVAKDDRMVGIRNAAMVAVSQ
jgi:hypothetical protein